MTYIFPSFTNIELLAVKTSPTCKESGISWANIDIGNATKGLDGALIDHLTLTAMCANKVVYQIILLIMRK